jgi:simple sugar transport system substrate-binding protein
MFLKLIKREKFMIKIFITFLTLITSMTFAAKADLPAPLNTGDVRIALVRQLSQGDFFQAYLSGVEQMSAALNINLQVFDAKGDPSLQADLMEQAINTKPDGIILQHGLTENMAPLAQKALDMGIKVVAFDVNVNNSNIPQIEQSDQLLAQLALDQAIKDNGESFNVGYVYVAGFAPLDRRDEKWKEYKNKYSGIKELAQFGAVNDSTAQTVADQGRAVILGNPEMNVIFAPYDEFAKGAKMAVDEAGKNTKIKIYSADISTADIQLMIEKDSAWVATAATNPAVVGKVSVRSLAMLIAGENPGASIIVPPTLITQKMLRDLKITNMEELGNNMPQFSMADVANPSWMPSTN